MGEAPLTGDVEPVRCVVVGDEPLTAQCVGIALDRGLKIVLVCTANPLVRDDASERMIPVVPPGAALAVALDEHPADVLLSIANLRVIPDAVLAKVRIGINYHDGPLPGYAGLNATSWALLAGETEHAITWHVMTSEVDGGEIVAVDRFPVHDDDTAFSLNARCYEAALATFPAIADAVAYGEVTTTPQPEGPRRLFLRHDRPALLYDPRRAAADTARDVRALDLGTRIRNSVGAVRFVLDDEVALIERVSVAAASGREPSTVVELTSAEARIATEGDDLVIDALTTAEGTPLPIGELFARHGIAVGDRVPNAPAALVAAIGDQEPILARSESQWLNSLAKSEITSVPTRWQRAADSATVQVTDGLDDPATAVAAIVAWLHRVVGHDQIAIGITDDHLRTQLVSLAPLTSVPAVSFDLTSTTTFEDLRAAAERALDQLAGRGALLRDAIARDPVLRGRELAPEILVDLGGVSTAPAGMRFVLDQGILRAEVATAPDDPDAPTHLAEQVATVLGAVSDAPATPLAELAVVGPTELAVLDRFNDTAVDHDRGATIVSAFRAQAQRTPDAPAVSCADRTLSYGELRDAVESFAARLAAAGAGPRDVVGIGVPRGIDMLVAVLATLEIGAVYLPLDPSYPTDRLSFMVADAGIVVLVAADTALASALGSEVTVVVPGEATAPVPTTPRPSGPAPDDLAYLIYTSGSTGQPKGVMLEHRQVLNFFVAMDDVIDVDPPGVWLAVTSLSFDISVLELLWTLTRGFHVVIKADQVARAASTTAGGPRRPVSFSLFYFAAGEDAAADGYRLLLESASFADRHGFEAVWTPERHFHAFGGAYPNPSVVGAALAATTSHVAVRAGSVVLPLHSPIRVAEEWAVVDNLSRGRVGISFAAGWQPNDFVLNPAAFAGAKERLADDIDAVKRLWRGETVSLPGHDGAPVAVSTLPRPVQPELPVWLTSAGTPATFERAGQLGVNVLTHLLGQSIEQLTENIERYRQAWREAGHEGEGHVTLMLHAYLAAGSDTAREVAREPMKRYLATAVGLLRDVASAFPTFRGRTEGTDDLFKSLTADELDQLLEVAADRYLASSGLFGTVDDAVDIVEQVSAAGVDEVACLIDFGIETDAVLASLDLLLQAKDQVDERRSPAQLAVAASTYDAAADTVAALVERHGVTHLQCTPSLAAMLVADPADRNALRRVRHLMLGGEALPPALASELRALLPDRFTNMYGPTETTIWSLVEEITAPPQGPVPIGRAIANTTVFVLDPQGQRVPLGAYGELHIGGEGVARGYHQRPELTANRFVERFGAGRVYATGDVVRFHPAGYVEFAGRADNQVKIRGHRIELGEIEAVLDRHDAVVQSVVDVRQHGADARLAAFVVLRRDATVTADELRHHVADVLPDAMVPSSITVLEALPLTPNGKVDRKALPAEVAGVAPAVVDRGAPPADDTERLVSEIWSEALERPVGRDDNFFDIGGHSLLAVKVFRRITDATSAPLALTDVFRFPTVRAFAAHVATVGGGDSGAGVRAPTEEPAATGADRGALRRRALARRGGGST